MHKLTKVWIFGIVALIVLLGLQLRLQAVRSTDVDTPIRADARGYLVYAMNLKSFGIFSMSEAALQGRVAAPTPDAIRTPGYPLFLRMFIGDAVTGATLYKIEITQALVSTLTILLAYATFAAFLNWPLAALAALLTAISPHLVFTNVYILTESLACFLLMLFLWSLSRWQATPSPWLVLASGALLALASLTRPWTQGFIVFLIPLVLFYSPVIRARRAALLLGAGFLLPMLFWIGRNLLTLGVFSDDTFLLSNFYQGTYPGLLYDNRPETLAYAYRFDPRVAEISASLGATATEILRQLREHPLDYLGWYTLGKPTFLFAWDIFEGAGDLLIYPVLRTPYTELGLFKVTHAIMHGLHNSLVILAILGSVAAWLPKSRLALDDTQRFVVRTCAALFAYFVLLHIILNPLARYSIPMRPVIYGMAVFALWYLGSRIGPWIPPWRGAAHPRSAGVDQDSGRLGSPGA